MEVKTQFRPTASRLMEMFANSFVNISKFMIAS